MMRSPADVLRAEKSFFDALVRPQAGGLDRLLADDFSLADLSGGLMSKAALIEAVFSGKLRFEAIEPVEAEVRFYGPAAIVTGRTEMRGSFEQTSFVVQSRYTHVFVEREGGVCLVAAQGTPISTG
jgi:Domain of unknown function (DUF4440)